MKYIKLFENSKKNNDAELGNPYRAFLNTTADLLIKEYYTGVDLEKMIDWKDDPVESIIEFIEEYLDSPDDLPGFRRKCIYEITNTIRDHILFNDGVDEISKYFVSVFYRNTNLDASYQWEELDDIQKIIKEKLRIVLNEQLLDAIEVKIKEDKSYYVEIKDLLDKFGGAGDQNWFNFYEMFLKKFKYMDRGIKTGLMHLKND